MTSVLTWVPQASGLRSELKSSGEGAKPLHGKSLGSHGIGSGENHGCPALHQDSCLLRELQHVTNPAHVYGGANFQWRVREAFFEYVLKSEISYVGATAVSAYQRKPESRESKGRPSKPTAEHYYITTIFYEP